MKERMEPFGADNPKPIFSISKARINKITPIGADLSHIRMQIEKNGRLINAVGFRMGYLANTKKAGDYIDIAFNMDINTYRDERSVQLVIKDIK